MRRALLFLFFAILLSLYPQEGNASGETFVPVDLYIYGEPDGQLEIDVPSSSNVESVVIGDGEQSAGITQEVGRWATSSLYVSSNISGDWSGKAWISSNRDATVTLTYTLIQDDENLNTLTVEGDVGAGETVAIGGEDDFSLTGIGDSPLTLLIESSWTAQPGTPPPPPSEGNTTITLEYGSGSRDTGLNIPISHVVITEGSPPNTNEGQSQVMVYLHVFDVFGVDDILSTEEGDYNMRMGPVDGESPWASVVDKVTDRGDYVEVQFLWSYEGHSLPTGDDGWNEYQIEAGVIDKLSDIEWSANLRTNIYIEPKPDIEIDPITSTSKQVEFGKSAVYTLSVQNTGSGSSGFTITLDNDLGWDVVSDTSDLDLDAGESKNIKVTVTPPDGVSDNTESRTELQVTGTSPYSDIYDSIYLFTTAEEPDPEWDFSIAVSKDGNENYDFSCGCFIINDREEIEIMLILTNDGNRQNNYNIEAISEESPDPFSLAFDPSFVSSLQPGQSIDLTLTLKPRDDYSGRSTYLVVEAVSSGDGKIEESEPISIVLEQSGNVAMSVSSPLNAPVGGTIVHSFQISNANNEEAKRVYLVVSGIDPDDKLAEGWVTFEDKDEKRIAYGSFLTILPEQTTVVTLRVNIPSSASVGSYNMEIWMSNDQNQRISDKSALDFVATEAIATEESNFLLYGSIALVFGGVLVYGYRNFFTDAGFEDDYDDDFDELEEIPEIIQTPTVPEVQSFEAPPPIVAEVPELVAEPVSKVRKKWFGLFGGGEPQVPDPATPPAIAEPVVAQPMAIEPAVVQPIPAEP
ncbi:MAG: hypothetical protein VYE80_03985, partial [Candidatus Thermoplasmatota archaeon]|nr:hypothetical protein [Candidatus Thermoplasmatota archaeon]